MIHGTAAEAMTAGKRRFVSTYDDISRYRCQDRGVVGLEPLDL